MIKRERLESNLPELDRTDDPRGGAAAWALLAVGATLIAGIVVAVMWATGAW
ncbi:MAG: hypothetical protein ACRDRX_23970 [Pseudonocardiaceae bacterium]